MRRRQESQIITARRSLSSFAYFFSVNPILPVLVFRTAPRNIPFCPSAPSLSERSRCSSSKSATPSRRTPHATVPRQGQPCSGRILLPAPCTLRARSLSDKTQIVHESTPVDCRVDSSQDRVEAVHGSASGPLFVFALRTAHTPAARCVYPSRSHPSPCRSTLESFGLHAFRGAPRLDSFPASLAKASVA